MTGNYLSVGGGGGGEGGYFFCDNGVFTLTPLNFTSVLFFLNFILSPYVGGKRFHDVPLPLLFQPPQKAVSLWIQVNAYFS